MKHTKSMHDHLDYLPSLAVLVNNIQPQVTDWSKLKLLNKEENRLSGVMVHMLTSSMYIVGSSPGSQNKEFKIGICCFVSKPATYKVETAKTSWLVINIRCQSDMSTPLAAVSVT